MPDISDLYDRGLVFDVSDRDLITKLPAETGFYVGFDPTAASLTVGNLVQVLLALHLTKLGLKPIILFGGATGYIGDPGGKSTERPFLAPEQIASNVEHQKQQILAIWGRSQLPEPIVVNNYDWSHSISILDFLREVGKHFPVNYMLQKDSIKSRLDGAGISYTEFSYMLLQANDFLHLYTYHNCRLQVGGQDQWGNITAGLELIRRKIQGEAYALSSPLITDSQGKKFGKSEGNAIWLDPGQTSSYHFYQFWLNTSDNEVGRLLKLFTFLSLDQIATLELEGTASPEQRIPQRALATSVTELVHGMAAARGAEDASRALFSGGITHLSKEELLQMFRDAPKTELTNSELEGLDLVTLLSKTICPSKGEARRLLGSGGVYLNNQRVQSEAVKPIEQLIADGNLLVLRTGKKNYHLVHVKS